MAMNKATKTCTWLYQTKRMDF